MLGEDFPAPQSVHALPLGPVCPGAHVMSCMGKLVLQNTRFRARCLALLCVCVEGGVWGLRRSTTRCNTQGVVDSMLEAAGARALASHQICLDTYTYLARMFYLKNPTPPGAGHAT